MPKYNIMVDPALTHDSKQAFKVNDLCSKENLSFAAHLSGLAYKTEDLIRTEIVGLGGTPEKLHFLYGKNLFGFVAKFSDFAFIVFRGTQARGDWKDNLDIRVVRTFYGEVHYGFARCLDSLSKQIIHEVIASFDKPYKLCLTGHSKGGALAMLATAVLVKNGYTPLVLYTFGQPKVGLKSFVKWWDTNVKTQCFRVENSGDIVPHLPPSLVDIPFLMIFALKAIVCSINFILNRLFGRKKEQN
jgi:triacylglycerol lipase